MNDPTDQRLRQLAEALVADRPSPPGDRRGACDVVPGPASGRFDSPPAGARGGRRHDRPRRRRIALAQGRSAVAPDAVDAASAPLVDVTTTSVASTTEPTPLLGHPYQMARGSTDDATQNLITPIGLDEVPAGVITVADAIAAAPLPLACPPSVAVPACDAPYSAARLARYQGFGGYSSAEDVDGPGTGDLRHDTIVWVVVESDGDFELASVPGGSFYLTGAVLIDAVSGELVSGGWLLAST